MALRMKRIAGVVAGALLAISGSAAVFAQEMPAKISDPAKAAAAAKERFEFMEKVLGDNEKLLRSVMRGEAPLDAKAVAAAEKINASTSAKEILAHFAPGTGDDVVKGTRARASIWNEWGKVQALAAAVNPATTAALAAAKSGDQKAFAEKEQVAVNACNACHKEYRAPRQR